MNLADLADRVSTMDVIAAVAVGLIVWGLVNALGIYISNKHIKHLVAKDKNPPREDMFKYSTILAGIKLLSSVIGIATGIAVVLVLAN